MQVESQLGAFSDTVSNGWTVPRKAARLAGMSAACGVIKVSVANGGPPTLDDMKRILVDALAVAAIGHIHIPFGSPAWVKLEELKNEVSEAITDDQSRRVDQTEVEFLWDQLACAWL